jgi:hypothetical protein
MKSLLRLILVAGLLAFSACKPTTLVQPPPQKQEVVQPAVSVEPDSFEAEPTPITVTVPEPPLASPSPSAAPAAIIADPPAVPLTPAGRSLIYEFEVGGRSGYNPHPEAPDARVSGVTWGIGYDAHQNSKAIILQDWLRLGEPVAKRLVATQPYYGASAQAHLKEVRDIIVSWQHASDVFDKIDVTREFASARRLWPGFDRLRPNAQAALISQGFNRGWSTAGANRREMAEMKALVPKRDYEGMAAAERASIRVWKGTSIYNGMVRRRYAEAKLLETP